MGIRFWPKQQACTERKRKAEKYKIPSEPIEFIRLLIEHDWSPEPIPEALTISGMDVSHAWIYQYLDDDKVQNGKCYRHVTTVLTIANGLSCKTGEYLVDLESYIYF